MTDIAAMIVEWRAAIPVMTEDEQRIHDWLMATAAKRRPSRASAMRFIARDIALGLHRYDPRQALADIVGGT